MTGVALHVLGPMCALVGRNLQAPCLGMGVATHQLGACRPLVVVARLGINTVLDQVYAPFLARIDQGPLVELSLAPFESLGAIRIAQERQIGAGGRCRGSRGAQCRIGIRGAMTVDARYLNRLGDLSVDVAVTMIVAGE